LPSNRRHFILFFPQVSWLRHRDVNLLAVGKFVYIRDDRFKVLHEKGDISVVY